MNVIMTHIDLHNVIRREPGTEKVFCFGRIFGWAGNNRYANGSRFMYVISRGQIRKMSIKTLQQGFFARLELELTKGIER